MAVKNYGLIISGIFVGMAVHDVGPYDKPFVPGVVFNVEPIIEDKELKIHLRLEDTIVTTATGSENLTSGTTVIPEQIYKLMKEKAWEKKPLFDATTLWLVNNLMPVEVLVMSIFSEILQIDWGLQSQAYGETR
jgi:hypothetical protein